MSVCFDDVRVLEVFIDGCLVFDLLKLAWANFILVKNFDCILLVIFDSQVDCSSCSLAERLHESVRSNG